MICHGQTDRQTDKSVYLLSAVPTCSGKLFHASGVPTLKARSPNFRCVLGSCKSDLVAERRTVPQDESMETGCGRSVITAITSYF